jgi:ABC-type glycerol-3-phosphate transport system permease component
MRKKWWRHAALILISVIMLAPFYWLLKTAITSENIYEYPPHLLPVRPQLFNFVDVWYLIPFPRYLFNSIVVSLIAVAGNLVLNAMAGFALTLPFVGRRSVIILLLSCTLIPFQATIIPAYLITAHLGLLNSYLGLALPLLSTIVCIFIFKASFDAVPRSLLPLSTPAIATNIVLSFIWSWNNFLWPLIITRSQDMQTLPLGLARFLSYMEDTTGALYAFVVMVLAPGLLVFLMAQSAFMRGLTTGATKG